MAAEEEDCEWELLYWPPYAEDEILGELNIKNRADMGGEPRKIFAGAGRAEYLRVVFEEAGVKYREVRDKKSLVDFFFRNPVEEQKFFFPTLCPPAIRSVKTNFMLAQTPACARYLGERFGLAPPPDGDGGSSEDRAHAEQINLTVHEYIAEGRMAFHPVKNTMSYYDQVEEAKPYIEAFKKERLPRYLSHFERLLAANNGGGGFFVGSDLTYVDLQVLVMLQVTDSQWPDTYSEVDIPLLHLFRKRMEERPRIKAYMASDRRNPFAGDSLM